VTGAYHLFVGEPSRQVPVNFALVRAGLARVERRNDRDQDQVLVFSSFTYKHQPDLSLSFVCFCLFSFTFRFVLFLLCG
jgi:hypothetical protein